MSLMCTMQECKQMPGMCKHEKMMLGVLLILVVGGGDLLSVELRGWDGPVQVIGDPVAQQGRHELKIFRPGEVVVSVR